MSYTSYDRWDWNRSKAFGLEGNQHYSAFGRRAGAGLVHTVIAVSEFVLVFVLEIVDATATIKLTAQNLISLDETLELTGQVSVLSLKTLCVLLKSITSCEKVAIVCAVL